jgi:hypothetical protein
VGTDDTEDFASDAPDNETARTERDEDHHVSASTARRRSKRIELQSLDQVVALERFCGSL